MNNKSSRTVIGASLLALAAAFLAPTASAEEAQEGAASAMLAADHVLLAPWTGPYGGVPPWDKVNPDEFVAAFDTAFASALAEIEAIANNRAAPTFENTIVAMERAGEPLSRLSSIYGVHASNLNLEPMPDIQRIVSPKYAAYADSIYQNKALFSRIEAVYTGREMRRLKPDQKRLTENAYKEFVRRGAKLNEAQSARLGEINLRLATLFTNFSQNVLNDEQGPVTWVERQADLAGIPAPIVAGMKNAATTLGQPNKWAVRNTRSAMDPVLTYAENRSLREKVWRTFYSRGDNGDANDTKGIIKEILKLRAERAALLGYETHAHWIIESQMARTPENAMGLMMAVWPKAVARAREEVADMQALADSEGARITIEPWDYRFYAEKVRKDKYDLDMNEVKAYLQLDKLTEGMMWSAQQIFGLTFREINNVPIFHDEVRVWEVVDAKGAHKGLFYLDPYARDGKRSGAWMTNYRAQNRLTNSSPIVSNNSNFVKTADGKPILISWDDAETLFHEFGHALHGLISDVTYPSQSGTSVPRDFVEFPSQIFEHWLSTPEVLNRFALHYETGERIPDELVEKIERAETFNQGFATVEYLAGALIDMKIHLAGAADIDPAAFERDTLAALGMPREIVMRHRTPHFLHAFASDGYSAGYYSYLWADSLTADAAEAFVEAGGFFDKKTAEKFARWILATGDTMDQAEAFRKFRGRDVDTAALMRKRGFPVE